MSRKIGGYVRQHHLVLILIFVALGGTAVAAGERGLTTDTINACVKKKSNALSLAKNGKCPKRSKAIAWNQEGPQGPAGQNGADGAAGAAGADGTAVAFGRINADGSISHARGITGVTHPQTGVYCVAIPAANATTQPMVAAVEYNGAAFQNGSAHFTDQADILSGGGQFSWAQWDSIPNFCPAGQYEVRTSRYLVDAISENINVEQANSAFSFVVP